jgi:hypothetical protein
VHCSFYFEIISNRNFWQDRIIRDKTRTDDATMFIYMLKRCIFLFNGSYSPLLAPGLLFSSVNIFYAVDRTSWASDKPVARPLPTYKTTQT